MTQIQTYNRDGRRNTVIEGEIESRRPGTRDLVGLECVDVRMTDGSPTRTVLVKVQD